MFSDNVPSVLLASWDLEASLYDGESTAGPVPSLYAEDVNVARTAIEADAMKAHADYMKISRTFFMPEAILIDEAVSIVKKPR